MIVVNDMEMPKNCYFCRFNYDGLCHACGQDLRGRRLEKNGRVKACPLYEVQDDDRWMSMETPPKEDGEYITKTNAYGKSKGVISQDYVTRTVRGKQIRRWEWNNRVSPWITTHWMPLPEPPKEETK